VEEPGERPPQHALMTEHLHHQVAQAGTEPLDWYRPRAKANETVDAKELARRDRARDTEQHQDPRGP